MKASAGRFFEDFELGETIVHGCPRTVTDGERALYHAFFPTRFALQSSAPFARRCGLPAAPLDDLAVFNIVFAKSVPDISLNARANLGYARCRWRVPVYTGDTVSAVSTVIGLREISSGRAGIVWVRTEGRKDTGEPVLDYVRWVLVHKRDDRQADPPAAVPELDATVQPAELVVPEAFGYADYDFEAAGEPYRLGDYEIGEWIDHGSGATLTEAEHVMATRLWQNTARVHFQSPAGAGGRQLVYGGHVMALARALSGNGLANAQRLVAINGGQHVNPCYAGDTIRAWSNVLDKTSTAVASVGALRLRLVAVRGELESFELRTDDGEYAADVLLDLDCWVLVPD